MAMPNHQQKMAQGPMATIVCLLGHHMCMFKSAADVGQEFITCSLAATTATLVSTASYERMVGGSR